MKKGNDSERFAESIAAVSTAVVNRKALKAQRGVSKASAGKQSTSREILGLTRFDQASSPVNLFGAEVNLAAVGLR